MSPILEIKKYVDVSLARSKILVLLALQPVLTQGESESAARTEAGTPSEQDLAFQHEVRATSGIANFEPPYFFNSSLCNYEDLERAKEVKQGSRDQPGSSE